MEIRFVPYLVIMLIIFYGIASLVEWHDKRIETKHQNLTRDPIVIEINPKKEQLSKIAHNKQFKQTDKTFQKAVLEKLKAYDLVPSTIEKTMSTAQLYKANNPLWTCNLSINTIKAILTLDNQLQKHNITIDEYMEEFIIDCKNEIQIEYALEKLLKKQLQKLQKQIQEHTTSLENQYRNLFVKQ